ncbi:3-deoxy-D-manno-octulosonic acid transferase, partial [Xanthomonas perforans]|nr:3-deoxy-D-manno-octulosonic acid transferase [Xanthomonas perforans]
RQADAVAICEDAECVYQALARLLADPAQREAMTTAGLALVANGKGAVARTLVQIAADLPPLASAGVVA